ncbi:hypothetical protein J0H58_01955 [bacterium]|mgnify:CR=1 FL=1|nr:hypothetical protein [bacterium]
MAGDTGFRQTFAALADQIGDVHERAVTAYSPVVEDILRTGNRDPRRIEPTLDGLLDFCGNAAILQLFRRLCRHYFGIDPVAAVAYVDAYRDMYGERKSDSVGGV